MKWEEFIKDYLTFTRKDKIGILVISAIMAGVIFLPEFISTKNNQATVIQDTSWFNAVKKLELKNSNPPTEEGADDEPGNFQIDRTKSSYNPDEYSKRKLFYFDPNSLANEGWKKLGLKEKTILTIQNYLGKGGHFYKPEDLKKIYGLRHDDYERLYPFIRIENANSKANEEFTPAKTASEINVSKNYSRGYPVLDINTADTSAFISLPGIGNKLATRIVNFREKLGGFYFIDQVGETYGLPDSTFQKIKQYLILGNASVKKININTATVDELKAHPYIKYSIANPMVAYRNEHGSFAKIEDLKNVMVMTDEIYKKISPYLSTQ